jgi:hypothetical protein
MAAYFLIYCYLNVLISYLIFSLISDFFQSGLICWSCFALSVSICFFKFSFPRFPLFTFTSLLLFWFGFLFVNLCLFDEFLFQIVNPLVQSEILLSRPGLSSLLHSFIWVLFELLIIFKTVFLDALSHVCRCWNSYFTLSF